MPHCCHRVCRHQLQYEYIEKICKCIWATLVTNIFDEINNNYDDDDDNDDCDDDNECDDDDANDNDDCYDSDCDSIIMIMMES